MSKHPGGLLGDDDRRDDEELSFIAPKKGNGGSSRPCLLDNVFVATVIVIVLVLVVVFLAVVFQNTSNGSKNNGNNAIAEIVVSRLPDTFFPITYELVSREHALVLYSLSRPPSTDNAHSHSLSFLFLAYRIFFYPSLISPASSTTRAT